MKRLEAQVCQGKKQWNKGTVKNLTFFASILCTAAQHFFQSQRHLECPNLLSSFSLFQFLTCSLILSSSLTDIISFFFFFRFLPLKFVELSVHSTDKKQLMLKLVNGRSYYLELCAPPDQQQQLFHHWLKLISLLKRPEDTSNTNVNIICKDSGTNHEKAPSPNNPPDNVSLWQIDIKSLS